MKSHRQIAMPVMMWLGRPAVHPVMHLAAPRTLGRATIVRKRIGSSTIAGDNNF